MALFSFGRSGVAAPDRSTADALKKAFRALRDGTLSFADLVQVSAMEGVVNCVSLGTITTPITFKAYDADQPELVLDVADGYTMLPLNLQAHIEDSAGTDNEIFAHTSKGTLIGAGTSTLLTQFNANTGYAAASGVTAYGAYSGNGTVPTTPNEFWRTGYAFADTTVGPLKVYNWNWRDYCPIVIKGPGAIAVYASATTTQMNGFLKASYIILPSTLVY